MVSVAPLKLEIILLAAGCSSRLGQAKQLVNINGQSLLVRQCQLALLINAKVNAKLNAEVNVQVNCVLGFQAKLMAKEISHLPVNCIENINWQRGLASSIATGVAALANKADLPDAVMLLLVDQWQLAANDIQSLIALWQAHPTTIVCAQQDARDGEKNTLGPPVIFPQDYFAHLAALSQGQGAKSIINRHSDNVMSLPLAHAFVDLDTPEQLTQLQSFVNRD